MPYFCLSLARAHAKARNVHAALGWLDQALLAVRRHHEPLWEPEIYRQSGELWLALGLDSLGPEGRMVSASHWPGSPKECFLKAIRLAQRSGAKMLELLAAVSFVRHCESGPERQRGCVELRRLLTELGQAHQAPDFLEAIGLMQ
jgi:hypothetical protein